MRERAAVLMELGQMSVTHMSIIAWASLPCVGTLDILPSRLAISRLTLPFWEENSSVIGQLCLIRGPHVLIHLLVLVSSQYPLSNLTHLRIREQVPACGFSEISRVLGS